MAKANKYTPYQSTEGALAAANEHNAVSKAQVITAGGTAENMAIPAGSNLARLCANADFWYEIDATAAEPTVDAASGASMFLPAGVERYITLPYGGSNISLVTATTGDICHVLFWD